VTGRKIRYKKSLDEKQEEERKAVSFLENESDLFIEKIQLLSVSK